MSKLVQTIIHTIWRVYKSKNERIIFFRRVETSLCKNSSENKPIIVIPTKILDDALLEIGIKKPYAMSNM